MAKKNGLRGSTTPAVKSVAQPADVAAGTQTGPGSSPLEDPEARGDARAATTSPLASSTKPNAVEVRGADGRFQQGSTHQRGPDRKPRQVARLGFTRALVAAEMRDGKPVSGFEDMTLALRRIFGNDNHRYFLGVVALTKDIFDDAPDSGSGRTTVFLFPSEVEEEMRKAGQPRSSEKREVPEAPPGPLAGMEEVEEPGG